MYGSEVGDKSQRFQAYGAELERQMDVGQQFNAVLRAAQSRGVGYSAQPPAPPPTQQKQYTHPLFTPSQASPVSMNYSGNSQLSPRVQEDAHIQLRQLQQRLAKLSTHVDQTLSDHVQADSVLRSESSLWRSPVSPPTASPRRHGTPVSPGISPIQSAVMRSMNTTASPVPRTPPSPMKRSPKREESFLEQSNHQLLEQLQMLQRKYDNSLSLKDEEIEGMKKRLSAVTDKLEDEVEAVEKQERKLAEVVRVSSKVREDNATMIAEVQKRSEEKLERVIVTNRKNLEAAEKHKAEVIEKLVQAETRQKMMTEELRKELAAMRTMQHAEESTVVTSLQRDMQHIQQRNTTLEGSCEQLTKQLMVARRESLSETNILRSSLDETRQELASLRNQKIPKSDTKKLTPKSPPLKPDKKVDIHSTPTKTSKKTYSPMKSPSASPPNRASVSPGEDDVSTDFEEATSNAVVSTYIPRGARVKGAQTHRVRAADVTLKSSPPVRPYSQYDVARCVSSSPQRAVRVSQEKLPSSPAVDPPAVCVPPTTPPAARLDAARRVAAVNRMRTRDQNASHPSVQSQPAPRPVVLRRIDQDAAVYPQPGAAAALLLNVDTSPSLSPISPDAGSTSLPVAFPSRTEDNEIESAWMTLTHPRSASAGSVTASAPASVKLIPVSVQSSSKPPTPQQNAQNHRESVQEQEWAGDDPIIFLPQVDEEEQVQEVDRLKQELEAERKQRRKEDEEREAAALQATKEREEARLKDLRRQIHEEEKLRAERKEEEKRHEEQQRQRKREEEQAELQRERDEHEREVRHKEQMLEEEHRLETMRRNFAEESEREKQSLERERAAQREREEKLEEQRLERERAWEEEKQAEMKKLAESRRSEPVESPLKLHHVHSDVGFSTVPSGSFHHTSGSFSGVLDTSEASPLSSPIALDHDAVVPPAARPKGASPSASTSVNSLIKQAFTNGKPPTSPPIQPLRNTSPSTPGRGRGAMPSRSPSPVASSVGRGRGVRVNSPSSSTMSIGRGRGSPGSPPSNPPSPMPSAKGASEATASQPAHHHAPKTLPQTTPDASVSQGKDILGKLRSSMIRTGTPPVGSKPASLAGSQSGSQSPNAQMLVSMLGRRSSSGSPAAPPGKGAPASTRTNTPPSGRGTPLTKPAPSPRSTTAAAAAAQILASHPKGAARPGTPSSGRGTPLDKPAPSPRGGSLSGSQSPNAQLLVSMLGRRSSSGSPAAPPGKGAPASTRTNTPPSGRGTPLTKPAPSPRSTTAAAAAAQILQSHPKGAARPGTPSSGRGSPITKPLSPAALPAKETAKGPQVGPKGKAPQERTKGSTKGPAKQPFARPEGLARPAEVALDRGRPTAPGSIKGGSKASIRPPSPLSPAREFLTTAMKGTVAPGKRSSSRGTVKGQGAKPSAKPTAKSATAPKR